jgi:hypothetical protein
MVSELLRCAINAADLMDFGLTTDYRIAAQE